MKRNGSVWFGSFFLLIALTACNTATNLPTAGPSPTTEIIYVIVEGPTATSTEALVPTPTPSYTFTPSLTPSVTFTPSPTVPTATPTITLTPSETPKPNPIRANLCQNCKARFRQSPGTAGRIISPGWVTQEMEFVVIGRTEDNTWAQVILTNGNREGWIAMQFVVPASDIGVLPVQGTAVDATEVPEALRVAASSAYVSGVTLHARQIYLRGQELGNKANIVTRVGDSISASPLFLAACGTTGLDLGSYQNQLYDSYGYFSGSLLNGSLAAGNGWGTTDILTAGRRPECGGDSSLVCEYKKARPGVALIMVGTNDSGGLPGDAFAANVRQIVQISMDMGVIPVLTTIPPKRNDSFNEQRANEFNAIITSIAREMDVPLVDYHAAMLTLPNLGLGPDGIHPNSPPGDTTCKFTEANLKYGFTMRNLTALQALDALYRQVLY